MKGKRAVMVLAAALSGCTSVKLAQRDGCWVRRTERPFGRVTEEIGPCALPAPPWVEDRLTRLVQECVARADYRWQSRALAAWNHGEKLPEQDEGNLLKECMSEASGAMITQKEKEVLETRLGEVSADRDALRARAEDDRAHLRESNDKLAEFLGEAARKPSPPATATATASSDGRASTESDSTPQAPVAIVGAAPTTGGEPARRAEPLRRARIGGKEVRPALVRAKAGPECPPSAEKTHAEPAPVTVGPGSDSTDPARGAVPAVPAAPSADGGP
jgi:hypothetical protein